MRKNIQHIIFLILGILFLNMVASKWYFRWDATKDKRYSLSQATKTLLDKIDKDLVIKVYLKGDFPLDFKRLEQATKQHLDELKIYNSHIHYRFINPSGMEEKLIKKQLHPSTLTVEKDGGITETLIFPWAIVSYKNKEVAVPLLIHSTHPEEQLQNSIENLEYAFSQAIYQVTQSKRKNIAILKGNGELEDIYLYDFLKALKVKYNLAPFSLHTSQNPDKVLDDLKKFDLCIIAKPKIAFTDTQKYILDQYITHNGKTMWLIDQVNAEMDSLQQSGAALFTPRDLNLTDLLFSYGVRINYNLVQDLYSSKIALATGNVGNKTQFRQFLWSYYPLISPNKNHPITKNIEAVNLKFPSGIDTLRNAVTKTILLQSSPLTKVEGLPAMVSLSSIADKKTPEKFHSKQQVLGVLLEGHFTSAFANRTKAFTTSFMEKSNPNKMLVVSDGDIIANQTLNGEPTRLDIDKWTGQHFGNKDFLLNSVDYLLDKNNLLKLRGKHLDIKLLNKEKVAKDKGFWQFITILLPLILLGLFGISYQYIRKKKYQ